MVRDTPLGFPAHTLHPQGVCGIRKAAQPLTAALPYYRGKSTILSKDSPRRVLQDTPGAFLLFLAISAV